MGNKNVFEIVKDRYFEHLGRTSNSVRYAGWFSIGVQGVIVQM